MITFLQIAGFLAVIAACVVLFHYVIEPWLDKHVGPIIDRWIMRD